MYLGGSGEIEHLSTEVEHHNNNDDKEKERDRIDWGRSKVQELSSKGHSQREIARVLQVGLATVNRNISCLRNHAKRPNQKVQLDS